MAMGEGKRTKKVSGSCNVDGWDGVRRDIVSHDEGAVWQRRHLFIV